MLSGIQTGNAPVYDKTHLHNMGEIDELNERIHALCYKINDTPQSVTKEDFEDDLNN